MKIKSIQKIISLDFASFKNYQNTNINFAKRNLIYGWNRSGKTTLSRVFASLGLKDYVDKNNNSKLIFQIQAYDINDKKYKLKPPLKESIENIMVFNSDFIEKNVFIKNDEYNVKPITLVVGGGDNIFTAIENLEKDKAATAKNIKKVTKITENWQDVINKSVKKINKIAKKAHNFKTRTDKNQIICFHIEVSDEINNADDKQLKEKIDNYNKLEEKTYPELKSLEIYLIDNNLFQEINNLLIEPWSPTNSIPRFNSFDVKGWAFAGYKLQLKKKNKVTCLFCNQKFPAEFWNDLKDYFNDRYQNIIKKVEEIIKILEGKRDDFPQNIYAKRDDFHVITIDKDIHPDFKNEFLDKWTKFKALETKYKTEINGIINKLKIKREEPSRKLSFNRAGINDLQEKITDLQEKINNFIIRYNESIQKKEEDLENKFSNLAKLIIVSKYKEIIDPSKTPAFPEDMEEANKQKEELESQYEELNDKIENLSIKTKSMAQATDKINKIINDFFGSDSIQLKAVEQNTLVVYNILRNGEDCKNLSESEKNIIAFVYFIIKCEELNEVNEKLIFIDDPISSLDSNFIFSISALIKEKFASVKQLFIFTHNFLFFNQMNIWLERYAKNNVKGPKDDEKKYSQFLLIEKNNNGSCLKIMPNYLKKSVNEFFYLFKKMNDIIDATSGTFRENFFEELNLAPNIMRKFLEIYFAFRWPGNKDFKAKFEAFCKANEFSEFKAEEILQICDCFSHFSSPEHDIFDNKNPIIVAIGNLFSLLEKGDKRFFDDLKKYIKNE